MGAELVYHHGARYWGSLKVEFQAVFTALVVNIKRWANIRLVSLKPAKIRHAI
ncbi:MAG: hypothetical protein WC364_12235 [Eubacteriales bacterium]